MPRNILPLLTIFFFPLLLCIPGCSNNKKVIDKNKTLLHIDSLKKTLDSTMKEYQRSMTALRDSLHGRDSIYATTKTASGKNEIYFLGKTDADTNIWKDLMVPIFPWIISIASLVIAYYGFMRTARFKNYDFLSEVDKQLIANPQLWAMYDKYRDRYYSEVKVTSGPEKREIKGLQELTFDGAIEIEVIAASQCYSSNNIIINGARSGTNCQLTPDKYTVTSSTSPQQLILNGNMIITFPAGANIREFKNKENQLLDDKVRAYCYLKLNNFESVLLNFKRRGHLFLSWERYLMDTLIQSKIFKQLAEEGVKREYFGPDFNKKVGRYLIILTDLIEDYHAAMDEENEAQSKMLWEKYNKRYKDTMNRKLKRKKYWFYFWKKKMALPAADR